MAHPRNAAYLGTGPAKFCRQLQPTLARHTRYLGDRLHKPSPPLGPVEEPPFYAVPVIPGDVGTYGGGVTDCDTRVLREDGSVIAGLYATGTTTASVMARAYPGAGCSIGPSFTWGYVAAKHAARSNSLSGASEPIRDSTVRGAADRRPRPTTAAR